MASYQERAEQAIEDQRWDEAADLLNRGIAETPLLENAYRMELRRAALPFYRDAINYELERPSQLTDAATSEVYEESRDILTQARADYREQVGVQSRKDTLEIRRRYTGMLTEQSKFILFSYVRMKQLDEVLVVPASSLQDYTGGRLAHDLGIYHPQADWHPVPRISLQAKHQVRLHAIEKYSPSVVIMGYDQEGEFGIDTKPVINQNSLSGSFAGENDHDLDEKVEQSYDHAHTIITNWPTVREEALARLSAKHSLTHRLDLSGLQLGFAIPQAESL